MNEQEIRADERAKVAYRIRAELVCCDIYERMHQEALKGYWDNRMGTYVMPKSWRDLKRSADYHDLCYFGEWSARIALDATEGCDSQGCAPNYWCPTAGEYESPCHGGFDTCCSHPELHREKE